MYHAILGQRLYTFSKNSLIPSHKPACQFPSTRRTALPVCQAPWSQRTIRVNLSNPHQPLPKEYIKLDRDTVPCIFDRDEPSTQGLCKGQVPVRGKLNGSSLSARVTSVGIDGNGADSKIEVGVWIRDTICMACAEEREKLHQNVPLDRIPTEYLV